MPETAWAQDDADGLLTTAQGTAERTLVASLLAEPSKLDEIDLSHDDFQDPRCGLVYRTARWMVDHDEPVSGPTVALRLARRLDAEFLAEVTNPAYAQPWTVATLAKGVADAAKRRRLLKAAYRLQELAREANEINEQVLAEAEAALTAVEVAPEVEGLRWVEDVAMDHAERLEERYRNKDLLVGIHTGFDDLDALIGGWRRQHLYILAARPSMGKSAFMLQTAMASAQRDVAVVFSLEMGEDMLLDRMLASSTGIGLHGLTSGHIRDEEWPKISMGMDTLSHLSLGLDVQSTITPDGIRRRLQRVVRKLDGRRLVVFVDYLQIVSSNKGYRSKLEEVSAVSTELKRLAVDLDCAVVALAQLSRSVEQRQDKRPLLSDIRESGQIEQDADVVMMLYRDDYYDAESEKKGVLEILVPKNRNGPTGKVEVAYLRNIQKIVGLSRKAN